MYLVVRVLTYCRGRVPWGWLQLVSFCVYIARLRVRKHVGVHACVAVAAAFNLAEFVRSFVSVSLCPKKRSFVEHANHAIVHADERVFHFCFYGVQ